MPKWTRHSLSSGSSETSGRQTSKHEIINWATKLSHYSRGTCRGLAGRGVGILNQGLWRTSLWERGLLSCLMSQYKLDWYKLNHLVFMKTRCHHFTSVNRRLKETVLQHHQEAWGPNKIQGNVASKLMIFSLHYAASSRLRICTSLILRVQALCQ